VVNSVEGLDKLRTFGWSLSSGVDVDGNTYNGESAIIVACFVSPLEKC